MHHAPPPPGTSFPFKAPPFLSRLLIPPQGSSFPIPRCKLGPYPPSVPPFWTLNRTSRTSRWTYLAVPPAQPSPSHFCQPGPPHLSGGDSAELSVRSATPAFLPFRRRPPAVLGVRY